MEYIGTIFTIIIVIVVIVNAIKNLNPDDKSSLQDKLNRKLAQMFGEQNNSVNSNEVKIYDENGNIINFQNNNGADELMDETIIYDEDGNVMNTDSPPVPVYEAEAIPEKRVASEPEINEVEAHADLYHDFIRSNGGSSIVIQEILGKPAALRDK